MNCSVEPVSYHNCDKCGYLMEEETVNIVDNLTDLEKNVPEDVLISLVYAAGYVVKNDKAIDDSFFYVSQFFRNLQEINRGGLKIPGELICQWVIYCYVTFLQSASITCCSSFSNLAMIICDMYNFNVGRYLRELLQTFSSIIFVNRIPHVQSFNQKLLELSC